MTERAATKADLETAIEAIWDIAQNAEGSRAGMQDALDQIQDQCVEVVPSVEAEDVTDDNDADGDGIEDD